MSSPKRKSATISDNFVTEQRALNLLKTLLPPEWPLREQHPDIFIDFFLEISSEREPQGIHAAIQVKGTDPKAPFRKAPNYRLKGKQARYVIRDCTVPYFLMLADLSNRVVYWVFLQEYIKRHLNNRQLQQNTITITFNLANKLCDPDAFKEAIVSAEKFMRELRPGSIAAAISSKKQELESKDNRIAVEIDVSGGKENIILHAKEPLSLTTTFRPINPGLSFPALKDFIESGTPVEIEVNDLVMTGSPLVESLSGGPARVGFAYAKPTEAELLLSPLGSSQLQLNGTITKGTKFSRFQGGLRNAPFQVAITFPLSAEHLKEGAIAFRFVDKEWMGFSVTSLPYFNQLKSLFRAFADKNPVGAELLVFGNSISHFELKNLPIERLKDPFSILDFLDCLRTICFHLKMDFKMPELRKVSFDDVDAATELAAVVTKGRFERKIPDLAATVTIDQSSDIPEGHPLELVLSYKSKGYRLLGLNITAGPLAVRLCDVIVASKKVTTKGYEIYLKGTDNSLQIVEGVPIEEKIDT